MQRKSLPIYAVLILLAAMVPLTGVDCNETGDFLRGQESRSFAAAVATQISSGITTALSCELGGRLFLGNVDNAGLRACDPNFQPPASTSDTTTTSP